MAVIAPTATDSPSRRQARRASWTRHTAAKAPTPMNATASLNSMPPQTATDSAASRGRDHSRSSRAVSASTSSDRQASAVYCFRSLRTSIEGTSSAAIAASTPAATADSRCRQPSCRANQYAITTATPANASGISRPTGYPAC